MPAFYMHMSARAHTIVFAFVVVAAERGCWWCLCGKRLFLDRGTSNADPVVGQDRISFKLGMVNMVY